MFKLDFTIETSQARNSFVSQHDLSRLSKKELELCANYILYGRDSDGTSSVDRKEVEIQTRFNSFKKKRTVSLDALLESPTFDESILSNNNHYRNIKPSIDKEKVKDIPGMKELWETIAGYERLLENPNLTSKEQYLLRHQLIQIKRQQYYLVDSVSSPVQSKKTPSLYFKPESDNHLNYTVLPRGVMSSPNDFDFTHPRADPKPVSVPKETKKSFDFLNYMHVQQLIINYEDLSDYISTIPDSPLHNLLWTLDFYIKKATLTPQQRFIVNCKKKRMSIHDIQILLEKELGISHRENYISTIYIQSVKKICSAASLNFDEWLCKDYDRAWKVCSCCGDEKLLDGRNFMRKSKSPDGFTTRCKSCYHKSRKGGELK